MCCLCLCLLLSWLLLLYIYINMCIHNWNRQPVLLRSGHAGWNPAPKGDNLDGVQPPSDWNLGSQSQPSKKIVQIYPHIKDPEMSLDHGFPKKKKAMSSSLLTASVAQLIKPPSWSESRPGHCCWAGATAPCGTATKVIHHDLVKVGYRGYPYIYSCYMVEIWGKTTYENLRILCI